MNVVLRMGKKSVQFIKIGVLGKPSPLGFDQKFCLEGWDLADFINLPWGCPKWDSNV